MPIRERGGKWHYRFYVDGYEYTGSTDLAATERNRTAANRVEAKSRELARTGKAHELTLHVRPFDEAAQEFLTWAEGEHREHPNTTKRLRVSFVSLCAFFWKSAGVSDSSRKRSRLHVLAQNKSDQRHYPSP
jgi:hypothetical protein